MTKAKKLILAIMFILIILMGLVIIGNGSIGTADFGGSKDVGNDNVSVAITGDVMFGRNMPGVLDTGSPFRNVEKVTKNADILLVNFENPATTSSNQVKGDVALKADPSYLHLLAEANDNVVAAQANNHAFDFGLDGMKDSIKNLKDSGIIPIGAGNNIEEASAPAIIDVGDRKVTILNYMDSDNFAEYSDSVMPKAGENKAGYAAYDSALAKKQIEEASKDSSCVIVYVHYGNEYSRSPNDMQVKISHECIDYGADIVVGTHTHVTQGIEMYKGKPIFYNLGNFIFDQSNPDTHRAYFLKLDLVEDMGKVTVYPIIINNYLPQFMDADSAKALLAELYPQCGNLTVNNDGTATLNFKLGNSTSSGDSNSDVAF